MREIVDKISEIVNKKHVPTCHAAKQSAGRNADRHPKGIRMIESYPETPCPANKSNAAHFTIATNAGGHLGKRVFIKNGELAKHHPKPLSSGTVEHVAMNLDELPGLFAKLEPNQCLIHGSVKGSRLGDTHKLTTADRQSGDLIARTQGFFEYHPCCLSMVDHDPDSQNPDGYMTPEALLTLFAGIDNQWHGVGHVVSPSTSAGICFSDGKPASGNSGYHIYFVCNGDPGPYFDLMFKHTVAMGHGWIKLSRIGSTLERSCFDCSVYKPERIDFTSLPVLGDGLTQSRSSIEFVEGVKLCCSL